MIKLKVGDNIRVLIGKDKGRESSIEKLFPKKSLVLVPGVNVYKRHVKGVPGQNVKGGIYDVPRPIAINKIALVCPKCKKTTRVGFIFVGSEKKRICLKCKREIDLREKVIKKK